MGDDAVHETKPHDPRAFGVAFDAVENVLLAGYILPEKAERTE